MDMQSGSQYQYGVRMLPLYWDSCYYFIVDLFVRKFHLFFLIDDLVALGNIMGLMCCTGYPITRSKSGRCHGFSLIIFPLPPPPLSRTDLLVFIYRYYISILQCSGEHLAEHCRIGYPKIPKLTLWFLADMAIVAYDIPEGKSFSLLQLKLIDGLFEYAGGISLKREVKWVVRAGSKLA